MKENSTNKVNLCYKIHVVLCKGIYYMHRHRQTTTIPPIIMWLVGTSIVVDIT